MSYLYEVPSLFALVMNKPNNLAQVLGVKKSYLKIINNPIIET